MKLLINYKTYAIIILITLTSYKLQAQNTYFLTIDSAISIAKEHSHRMRMLKETLYQAQKQVQSIKRSFLPRLDFNGTLPNYGEELKYFSDSASTYQYMEKNLLYSGSFRLSQKLPTDASLSANYNIINLDNYKTPNRRNFSTETKISLDQPINSLFAYNATAARYKQAKLTLELAEKQYKRNELDLTYRISQLFYNCITAEKQMDIALQTLKRQEEAYKLAKNKYETGLIKEVEALQIEVDYDDAQNNYESQITGYIQSNNELKLELGLSLKDSVKLKSNIEYKEVIINPETAVEKGLKNRTELREKEIQIIYNKLDIKRQRAEGMVKGSLGVYYRLYGTSTSGFDYPYLSAYETSMQNMFNKPGNYGLSFTLSIPILDWGSNRSLVKMYKSRLNQSMISYEYDALVIENEIRNTINRINSNLKKLLLLEKTIKLSEKSYDISYQRFVNGDIDVEALGLDRIRYTNAQNSYLQAYISYKLQLLDLNRKTFYDFENNRTLVTEDSEQ